MNNQDWIGSDEFNAAAEARHQARVARQDARRQEFERQFTAAVRQHNHQIVALMAVIGTLGMALGFLLCYISL